MQILLLFVACIAHQSLAISTLSASGFTLTAPSGSNPLRLRGGAPASTSPTMFPWGSKNAEPKFLPIPMAPAEELIASRVSIKHLNIHPRLVPTRYCLPISLSLSLSLFFCVSLANTLINLCTHGISPNLSMLLPTLLIINVSPLNPFLGPQTIISTWPDHNIPRAFPALTTKPFGEQCRFPAQTL